MSFFFLLELLAVKDGDLVEVLDLLRNDPVTFGTFPDLQVLDRVSEIDDRRETEAAFGAAKALLVAVGSLH